MTTIETLTILIVGVSPGGLKVGALLEKYDVPYTIIERGAVVKPLA
jgi:2-polyprenyl-6-methoxyphenol hydroxylase-like FAD-dependent oxidoreductase